MATTVDQLIVEIRAETKKLKKAMDGVDKRLQKTQSKTKKLDGAFSKLGGILATIGVGAALKGIIDTNRKFEDLEATLRAVTGGAKQAAASFRLIRRFTATTTFQVDEVAEAFIKLYQAGVLPTEEAMRDFGNLAAGMGRSITQLAQATFNATTGEMEMLKQFGIIAKLQGDQISATFEGQTKVIERSGAAITEYLREIGSNRFGTALAERAKTVSGAFSNLADATAEFQVQIGEAGLNRELTEFVIKIKDVVINLEPLAVAFGAVTAEIIGAMNALIDFTKSMGNFTMEGLKAAPMLENFILAARALHILGLAKRDVDDLSMSFEDLVKLQPTLKQALNPTAFGRFTIINDLISDVDKAKDRLSELITNDFALLKTTLEEVAQTKLQLEMGINPEAFGTVGRDKDGNRIAETFKASDALIAKRKAEIFKELLGGHDSFEELTQAIDTYLDDTDDVIAATDLMADSIIKGAQAFSDDFVDSLLAGEDALSSFKDFSRSLVSEIISIFLRLEVVNRLLASIFPGVAGIQYGGIISDAGVTTGKASAGGGTVQAGQPVNVGERGAEIFVPNTGGKILNNMNSKNAMGGGTTVINQSINFATGVVPTVRAEVMKMMPQIADVTKGAVAEAAMRGGNYRRALQGG